MTPLPHGWAVAPLEQLTAPDRPICYGILMPKEHVAEGVPYVKVKDFPSGSIDVASLRRTAPEIAAKYARSTLRSGDVLVSIRGTYGRVAIVPNELAGANITQDTARVTPSGAIDGRFLAHFLRSKAAQHFFGEVARGVAVKGVNIGDLRRLPCPVPPMAEQHQIVAAIDEHLSRLDAGTAALESARRRLRLLRMATAIQAVSGDWPTKRIGDFATVGSGATPKRGRPDYYENGTVPWVTSGQLVSEFVTEPAAYITQKALRETNVKLWPKHTLLVAMYGEGRTRGHCSELKFESTTNQACAAIVVPEDAPLRRDFLKLVFAAYYERNRRLATGGVQPNLSLGLVRAMEVPVPPLDEQRRVVEEAQRHHSIIDELSTVIDHARIRSEHLRDSTLAEAFSGRLVPQDPNDEPGSELLSRVAADRVDPPKRRRRQRA